MDFLRVNLDIKNLPELDPEFIPLHKFNEAFLRGAEKPVGIALERAGGEMAAVETRIHGTPEMYAADCYYIDRLVKTMLWMKGGWRVYISGDREMCEYIRECFSADGCQAFDWDYFSHIYERPFEVVYAEKLPEAKDSPRPAGGHFDGCRIGFDAGGSDRKVSAVIDGETVELAAGDWIRVAPAAKRQFSVAEDSAISFACIPRRSCGFPRRQRTRTTTMMASLPHSGRRRSICRAWTPWACRAPVCI